jgi:hypothetical protein
MSEETREIINLLMQLFPEDLAKYSHVLYSNDDMFMDERVELIKNWLKEREDS